MKFGSLCRATSAIFSISARHPAEALFRALDKEFSGRDFEPEDCGFNLAQFSGVVKEEAARLREGSGLMHSHPLGAAVAPVASNQSFAARGDPWRSCAAIPPKPRLRATAPRSCRIDDYDVGTVLRSL
jgi:hypothetical protein